MKNNMPVPLQLKKTPESQNQRENRKELSLY